MNAFTKMLTFLEAKLSEADFEKFLKILVLYNAEVTDKPMLSQVAKTNKSLIRKINELRRES